MQPFAPASPASTTLSVPLRRTWLSLPLLGLLAARSSWAQAPGGMGGGRGPGERESGSSKCAASAAEPAGSMLIKLYAEERLRTLPEELALAPAQLALYARYADALQRLILDENSWAVRAPQADANPLASIGAQIDRANNRSAAWEDVLDAVKPLYAQLNPEQQAIARKRLVVSLEPSAWPAGGASRPNGPRGGEAPPPAP
jgi:hypothetical protein